MSGFLPCKTHHFHDVSTHPCTAVMADGSRCGFKPSAEYRAANTERGPEPKPEPESDDEEEDTVKADSRTTTTVEPEEGTLQIKVGDGEWSAPMTVEQLEAAARRLENVTPEQEEKLKKRRELRRKTPAFEESSYLWPTHFGSDFYPVPCEDVFKDDEDQDLSFIPGADIERIADMLIGRHPELFKVIQNFRMVYRWRAKGGQRQGQRVLGRCQKTAGLLKEFSKADFIIMLSGDHCRSCRLTFRQIEALVFHELCHVEANDNYQPRVNGHDFEAFVQEVKIYGAWKSDLQLAEAAFVQPSLFDQTGGLDHGE